ncbi:MAG TPA: substrate-binding domain-containing protein [Planctomycetota bacterium]|nr:substrate-binding domain-containing protein [Planctomycetota bacterium]
MRTLLLCVLLAACGGRDAPRVLRLATTTSTRDSGLLDLLLPPFEMKEDIEVQVIAVGTGQALELGKRGDADLVLVHARTLEDKFVAEGHGTDRRDVMYNDFVVLGPPADPAGVKGKGVVDAFRTIAERGAPFVSRGDKSGTHVRELQIWEKAGGAPAGRDFYLDAGQGMGECITLAAEKGAYLLADRGTWLAFKSKGGLQVLVEGDKLLRNEYGVILPTHEKADKALGRRLLDYLTSPEGQKRIGEYKIDGEQLFHPTGK